MKSVLKFLALSIFCFSQQINALVILQYHHISDTTPKSTSLSPALFEQHLNYLNNNNFQVISLKQASLMLQQGRLIADKSVVITFDDGYRSIFTEAFPLLKKYNFPFTVFVNTSPIEHQLPQFMGWQELQKLIDNGGSIGNHTVNHAHLIKKNKRNISSQTEMIISEIQDAQRLLEKNLSEVLKAFAYPYGEYDLVTKATVKKLGYIAFGQQSGAVPINADLQAIPRFPFGGDYGELDDFIVKVNSLPMPIEKIILLDKDDNRLDEHLLSKGQNKVKLKMFLAKEGRAINITCYSSDGSQLSRTEISDSTFIFSSLNDLPIGRSRYNCTAASLEKGRFYWFSQPWIKANEFGNYFSETEL